MSRMMPSRTDCHFDRRRKRRRRRNEDLLTRRRLSFSFSFLANGLWLWLSLIVASALDNNNNAMMTTTTVQAFPTTAPSSSVFFGRDVTISTRRTHRPFWSSSSLFGELGSGESSSSGGDGSTGGIEFDGSSLSAADDSSSFSSVAVSIDNSIPDASSPSVKTTTQDAPEKHDFFFANNFTAASTSSGEASSVSSSLSEDKDDDENIVVSVLNSYDDDDDDDEIYVGISIDNSIPDDSSTSSTIPTNVTSARSSRSEVVNSNTSLERQLSRRQLFQTGAVSALIFGGVWGKELLTQAPEPPPPTKPAMKPPPLPKLPATSNADANRNQPLPKPVSSSASSATVGKNATLSTSSSQPKTKAAGSQTKEVSSQGRIETVNLTQVAKETNINITLECNSGCISVDSKNFTKTRAAKVPKWLPSFLTPSPQVVKIYQNEELLIASTVAGAATEMVRTSLLYPLQTIKTRIQTDPHNFTMRAPPIEKKVAILGTNIRRYAKEGNLYAGITPTLLAAVPATGLYFGVRDVTKRMLNMFQMEDIVVTLTAAFVADVVSLVFRTPADALALRLQAQNDDGGGDWLGDSLKRLPVVIATDFPYLLTKICINRLFIHGSISIDQYTEFAILSAVVAALLTTPFDVARTRILVDSDGDFSNGKDGGSGESLFQTMKKLTQEGDGGIQNLFAGWLERVLYLGIGRAWLEPIQIIGYVGIRDTLLLRWF